MRVFVYGTLKKEHGNHGILSNSTFLGYDSITGPFRMVSLGGFPGVVEDSSVDGATTIYGEIWAIEERTLERCDWLEGHPEFYERKKYRSDCLDRKAWIYLLPPRYLHVREGERYPIVESGCWRPTSAEVDHWAKEGVHIDAAAA